MVSKRAGGSTHEVVSVIIGFDELDRVFPADLNHNTRPTQVLQCGCKFGGVTPDTHEFAARNQRSGMQSNHSRHLPGSGPGQRYGYWLAAERGQSNCRIAQLLSRQP